MDYFFYICLFIFGTLFGSFGSVIIFRLKNKQPGIITGRSKCPICNHRLGILDLFPIFSYLFSFGKCRYCRKKISILYLLLESCTGILFTLIGYFLIDTNLLFSGDKLEIFKLVFFLYFAFLTIIYVFFDILYLEILESVLLLLIIPTFIIMSLQSTLYGFTIINILPEYNENIDIFKTIGIIIFGGIMIMSLYYIMYAELQYIYDIIILFLIVAGIGYIYYYLGINLQQTAIGSGIIASFFIFLFLFLQIFISNGNWMGGGDLRIGILIGLVCGISFGWYSIIISYILGSIYGIIYIIVSKIKKYNTIKKTFLYKIKNILKIPQKKIEINTEIPFGPFLALGIFSVLFFSNEINSVISKIYIYL